jgi:hypothetical protein
MDIQDLRRLAGIDNNSSEPSLGENISHTGTEKAQYMRRHNIQPGTPEWFRLWFALPKLTGENPMPRNNK